MENEDTQPTLRITLPQHKRGFSGCLEKYRNGYNFKLLLGGRIVAEGWISGSASHVKRTLATHYEADLMSLGYSSYDVVWRHEKC